MITINGRDVHTVAELRVGDRLPTPSYLDGYIEIAAIEQGENTAGHTMYGISWAHDAVTDPNAAPSLFPCHWELGEEDDGAYKLTRKRPTPFSRHTHIGSTPDRQAIGLPGLCD